MCSRRRGPDPCVSIDEIIPVYRYCLDINLTVNKYSVPLEPSLCIDESSRGACRALSVTGQQIIGLLIITVIHIELLIRISEHNRIAVITSVCSVLNS